MLLFRHDHDSTVSKVDPVLKLYRSVCFSYIYLYVDFITLSQIKDLGF